jgi:hypothetical protein
MNLFTRKAASVAAFTVLGITAGGIAWAESSTAPASTALASTGPAVTQAAPEAANTGAGDSTVDAAGPAAGERLRGFGKRVVHGEVVLQTKKGFVTAVIARGTVTAIDANNVSVKSPDGVTTSFSIDQKTRARSAGQKIAISAIHVGDKVGVLGVKTGGAAPLARMIRKLPG